MRHQTHTYEPITVHLQSVSSVSSFVNLWVNYYRGNMSSHIQFFCLLVATKLLAVVTVLVVSGGARLS
jgi:hypothetical protein